MSWTASVFPLLAVILAACAQVDSPAAEFETLQAETLWKAENGHETRTIVLSGGIVVSQDREGGKISSVEMDRSGHGAVLCAWQLFIDQKLILEACPGDDIDWAQEFSTAVDRTNDFIIANSFDRPTKQQLEDHIAQRLAGYTQKLATMSTADAERTCRNMRAAPKAMKIFKAMGHEKFRAYVDDLLSVPRLPVLVPCL